MSHTITLGALSCVLLCALAPAGVSAVDAPSQLTLEQAESLALGDDPLAARFDSLAQAQREQAVAEGQLPDPKLKLGFLNFPTDTFSRTQEPMTQVLLGVSQAIPRGDTLGIMSHRAETLAEAEVARGKERRRKVLLGVREAWLDVSQQVRSAEIVRASRVYFEQLVNVTEAQYVAGRSNQQDVLRAQLELSRLDDRYTTIRTQEQTARAQLARWVGGAAESPFPPEPPRLAQLPPLEVLIEGIPKHPAVEIENVQIAAQRLGSDLAREAYKPAWMLDLSYGNRIGDNPDGSSRADFLSAMVSMDVPLFPDKRQDRRLAASEQQVAAAVSVRDDRLREMRRGLEADYAKWLGFAERQRLYTDHLLPEAAANARAALNAYQAGVTEFTTLMRARLSELDIRLEEVRLQVERQKTGARLLYFVEDEQ